MLDSDRRSSGPDFYPFRWHIFMIIGFFLFFFGLFFFSFSLLFLNFNLDFHLSEIL